MSWSPYRLTEGIVTSGLLRQPMRRALLEPLAANWDLARKLLVCHYGQKLQHAGQLSGRSGNLSVRLTDGRTVAVTPRGADKGALLPSDLVEVTVDPSVSPPETASVELPMHLSCYRAAEAIGAVIHTHAPALTALGLRSLRLDRELPELDQAIGRVERIPFLRSGTAELADAVTEAVREGTGLMILARHGSVAVGRDLAEAHARLDLAESSARAVLLSLGADSSRGPGTPGSGAGA